jgi:hypothetical protein
VGLSVALLFDSANCEQVVETALGEDVSKDPFGEEAFDGEHSRDDVLSFLTISRK